MKDILPPELQKQIQDFVDSHDLKGREYKHENLGISEAVLKLETFINSIRWNNGTITRYDVTLASKSILESFRHIKPEQFHRPVDYQYAFLYWLFENYDDALTLADHIDGFFFASNRYLNYPDILMTKTGATRCKTNLRLCIFALREWGILLRTDNKDKRAFNLSPFGMLLMFYLHFESKSDPYQSLSNPGVYINRSIDDRIANAYYKLRTKSGLESLLSHIKDLDLTKEEKTALAKYSEQFIEVFFNYLQVRKSGVKQTKQDREIVAEFVRKTARNREFKIIQEKLMNYFTNRNR